MTSKREASWKTSSSSRTWWGSVSRQLVVLPQGPGAGRRPAAPFVSRVAAGEQRDLVAQPHQLLGQVGDDPLRAAVQLGRDALVTAGRPVRSSCDSPVLMWQSAGSRTRAVFGADSHAFAARYFCGHDRMATMVMAIMTDATYSSKCMTRTLQSAICPEITCGSGAEDGLNGSFDEPIVHRNFQPKFGSPYTELRAAIDRWYDSGSSRHPALG